MNHYPLKNKNEFFWFGIIRGLPFLSISLFAIFFKQMTVSTRFVLLMIILLLLLISSLINWYVFIKRFHKSKLKKYNRNLNEAIKVHRHFSHFIIPNKSLDDLSTLINETPKFTGKLNVYTKIFRINFFNSMEFLVPRVRYLEIELYFLKNRLDLDSFAYKRNRIVFTKSSIYKLLTDSQVESVLGWCIVDENSNVSYKMNHYIVHKDDKLNIFTKTFFMISKKQILFIDLNITFILHHYIYKNILTKKKHTNL